MCIDGTPIAKLAVRITVCALLALLPVSSAILAVAFAPPTRIEIAGQRVSVKPVIGQDTSRLLDGALVSPYHAHVALIGKDIGVDVDADWNRLIPSDRRTRDYLTNLWHDPVPEIARIQDAARHHVVFWGGVGFAIGTALVAGCGIALIQRRRRLASYSPRDAALVQGHNRVLRRALILAGVATVLGAHSLALDVYLHEDHHTVVGSPVFAGTSLEGMEVNGLMADVLPFLSILRPRSTFYDAVAANLENAIDRQPTLQRSDDEVVLVLAEDFEDVNGMARQAGLAADLVDATFLAITGDLTFAGLPIETYIIDTVDHYSDGRPVYFTPGLHDTEVVVAAARARDWHVAEGEVAEVEGLTLLSAADPRISTVGSFGTNNQLRDPNMDVAEFLDDTVQVACAERPDLVLLHDHRLGREIAEAGCQEIAVLDGRSFEFLGPERVATTDGGSTLHFTGGSSGGHTDTRPDPGNIKDPATFSVLTVPDDGGQATYAVVTVRPDASVTVTPEISLEVPYAEFLDTGVTGVGLPAHAAVPGRP
jgi:hypothetical protein